MNNFTTHNTQAPAPESLSTAERMLQEYLNSMKLMIQAQRDVMLSFMGQNPQVNPMPVYNTPAPVPAPERTIPVQQVQQKEPLLWLLLLWR
jgi:hypothetical protein